MVYLPPAPIKDANIRVIFNTGVACVVQPVLPILDMLYSTRLVLDSLARQYGRIPQKWPPTVVAQLRQRNSLLEQRIQRVICSLSGASYFILGEPHHHTTTPPRRETSCLRQVGSIATEFSWAAL